MPCNLSVLEVGKDPDLGITDRPFPSWRRGWGSKSGAFDEPSRPLTCKTRLRCLKSEFRSDMGSASCASDGGAKVSSPSWRLGVVSFGDVKCRFRWRNWLVVHNYRSWKIYLRFNVIDFSGADWGDNEFWPVMRLWLELMKVISLLSRCMTVRIVYIGEDPLSHSC